VKLRNALKDLDCAVHKSFTGIKTAQVTKSEKEWLPKYVERKLRVSQLVSDINEIDN
jgi:hypothetical protein